MKRLNVCVKNELAAAPFRSCCRFDVDLSGRGGRMPPWSSTSAAAVIRKCCLSLQPPGSCGCSPLINIQQPESRLPPKSKANFGLLKAAVDGRVDGEKKGRKRSR